MMASTYARMSFAAYPSASMACVIKDVPGIDKPAAVGRAEPAPLLDVEALGRLLDLLYEAALDANAWKPFLEALRLVLRGNFVSLIVRPGDADNIGMIISAAGNRVDLLPSHPRMASSPFRGIPTDRVMTVTDLMSEAEWRSSSYYQDWCRAQDIYHVMAVDVPSKEGSIYGVRITRPESAGPFQKPERDVLRVLQPHFKRALSMHLAANQDKQVISLYSHAMAQLMVGVVILDQNGMVIESNPAAAGILDMEDGLKISGGMLEATYGNDNRKLQRLIKDALLHSQVSRMTMTEGISVSRQSGQLNWGVVVQSISPDEWSEGKQRPSVAVFMRDTDGKADPPVRLAQQLFQLTPAETSLAIQLANGLSLEEAAEALNIRRNTARAHLRSIFSKTGVRRQTELVRIFLNSVAWLGSK